MYHSQFYENLHGDIHFVIGVNVYRDIISFLNDCSLHILLIMPNLCSKYTIFSPYDSIRIHICHRMINFKTNVIHGTMNPSKTIVV